MRSTKFCVEINFPTIGEFALSYPPYGPWARGAGQFLFELVMSEEIFLRARFATEMGLPAVAGIAAVCDAAARARGFELRDDKFSKQAIGAAVCVLLEANGFEKTSERRAIPHAAFTKGTIYRTNTMTNLTAANAAAKICALHPAGTTLTSHDFEREAIKHFRTESALDFLDHIDKPDALHSFSLAFGRYLSRALPGHALATQKVTSTNLRGDQTENQQWQII